MKSGVMLLIFKKINPYIQQHPPEYF